jgi:hypothetical protein
LERVIEENRNLYALMFELSKRGFKVTIKENKGSFYADCPSGARLAWSRHRKKLLWYPYRPHRGFGFKRIGIKKLIKALETMPETATTDIVIQYSGRQPHEVLERKAY